VSLEINTLLIGFERLVFSNIQGEHKVFPWLQTFVTRKLRGIQTYFLSLFKLVSKKTLLELSYNLKKKKYVRIPHSFLVINVCNLGKTLCSHCRMRGNATLQWH